MGRCQPVAQQQDSQTMTDDGLVVKQSVIPNAGLGLFATRPYGEGDELPCVYEGDVMTSPELLQIPARNRDYVLGLSHGVHINAANHPNVLARYINDNLTGLVAARHNVKFVKLPVHKPPMARVVALRDIAAGEELYADYGADFWSHRDDIRGWQTCGLLFEHTLYASPRDVLHVAANVGSVAVASLPFLLLAHLGGVDPVAVLCRGVCLMGMLTGLDIDSHSVCSPLFYAP
eukprot:SAG31_NODE_641_length_13313_cov_5.365219_1_plen_232_part_00